MSDWIKCSERMPDSDDCWVLAVTSSGDVFTAFYSYRFEYWDDGCSYEDIKDITHWQPLPPPPKD